MKDAADQLLETTVEAWATSNAVDVTILPATRDGPQAIHVQPRNSGSVSLRLWTSDDGKHVACSIGSGSWWDRAVPLKRESILELLSVVAAGAAWEELRRVGTHIVGRRGCIDLPSGRLTYGQLFTVPGLKWQSERHDPY